MNTIDKIVQDSGYTIEYINECIENGICNGMGGKGGIQITKKLRQLKYFQKERENKLLSDLDTVSNIHDIEFEIGGGIIFFFQSNYRLAFNIIKLLHWTNIFGRIGIFCGIFFIVSTFGIKYYHWKI